MGAILRMVQNNAALCGEHLRINERNIARQEDLKEKLVKARKARETLTKTRETLFSARKAGSTFLAEKMKLSFADIESAISAAGTIIQGVGSGIHLENDAKNAYIADSEGVDVADAEGAAYSAVVSILFVDSVLSNTRYMPSVCWDEPFATLSGDTSVAMSAYLAIMGERQQVILIEQKAETFVAGVAMTVTFIKRGWESEVSVVCSSSEEN